MNPLWQLIAAFSGGAVAVAIFAKVAGKWIVERAATAVDAHLKHTYDREIEGLRAALAKDVDRHKARSRFGDANRSGASGSGSPAHRVRTRNAIRATSRAARSGDH